jgi:hypothetical protein
VPVTVGCAASVVINPVATIAANAIAAYQSGHTNAATASTGTASATGPPISAITTHTKPSPIQAERGGRDGLNRWPPAPSAATATSFDTGLGAVGCSVLALRANAKVGQFERNTVRPSHPPERGIDVAGADRVKARSIWSCTLLRLRRAVASASSARTPAAERIIQA